jgi:hypothetical protein
MAEFSGLSARRAGILAPPKGGDGLDFGILRVSTPDGQRREYPLDVAQVFIGRAEGNRVVIDHVSVSRRHARLDFLNGQALLEDLQSATGTYVSGQRLGPGSPRAIAAGETLRFGECQATLIPATPTVPAEDTGLVAPGGGARPATRVEQAIAVSIASPGAPIAPGSAATATVTVQNRGNVTDTVQVAIQGLPEAWVRVTRPSVQLMPDAREEVVVIVQPPREPASFAGQHEFAAAATSLQHGVEVRALARVTISPFGDLSLEVRPAQSRGSFTANVENQSNSPARITMRATDRGDEVGVTFQPAELELQPNETASVQMDARLRKASFFGKESRHPFTAEAKADTRVATANAELRYRPPWLLWRWVVLGVLLVALAAGGWFAYSAFASGDDDPASPDETPGTPETQTGETPGTPETPPPQTTTAADGLQVGSTAVVTNSPEGDCLLVRPFHTRQSADPRSQPIARICDGTRVTITGPRVEDEGYYWYQIRTDAGVEGWSAEGLASGGPRFLTAAQ